MLASTSSDMSPSGPLRKLSLLTLVFVTALFGFTWFSSLDDHLRISTWAIPDRLATVAGPDAHLFSDLNLGDVFEYTRRCVIPVSEHSIERTSRQTVAASLLSPDDYTHEAHNISTSHAFVLPNCTATMSLPVPDSTARRDTRLLSSKHIMFGIVTTTERLTSSLPEMSHWLAHTGAHLLVLVSVVEEGSNLNDIPALLKEAASLGIRLDIRTSTLDTPRANLELARAMTQTARSAVKWFSIIDDDTFLLSVDAVLDALYQHDATTSMYVGQLTDHQGGVDLEGIKAWGGAGIFLSRPLATHLAANLAHCLNFGDQNAMTWGDLIIRNCIQLVTSPVVQLTPLPGLYQLDNFGSMDGWYESGRTDLITIHHWKSWHRFPVPEAHSVSRVAGYRSFLQRYVYDDDVVLTNGYSIVKYSKGLPDLDLMEHTFDTRFGDGPGWVHQKDRDNIRFIHGRTRRPLSADEKLSWTFEKSVEAVLDGRRCVRQFYIRRARADGDVAADDDGGNGNGNGNKMNSVIEVDWCES